MSYRLGTRPLLQTPEARVASGARTSSGVIEPVQAPWIRPGVVVHDPATSADRLIGDFALALRERGFNVVGYVRREDAERRSGTDGASLPMYLDLGTSRPLPEERGAAETCLRKAMREDADLLVIGRFSACTAATESIRPLIGADGLQGLPMLTSIAGECIHQWHSYVRHEGAMIAPDPRSLWTWWGPERLYRDLALGVAEHEVHQIVCGQRWIMVEGPFGAGLAYLPKHPRELLPRLSGLARENLRTLADMSQSWDPLETAVGIAAINAHYNRFERDGRPGNGVKMFRAISDRVIVVGAFPGIEGILPRCSVVEANPRPGEFPPAAMDALLPGCAAAVVNSSALVNRSLPRILRLARNRPVALIGPTTPMTPRLFDYGLSLLGGLVVTDPRGLGRAIRAGALPREFGRFGRFVHITRDAADTVRPIRVEGGAPLR